MADSESENVCLEQPSKQARVNSLIERIEAHEKEAGAIDHEIIALGLDTKKVRAIRATKRTLDALMGIDPGAAERVQP